MTKNPEPLESKVDQAAVKAKDGIEAVTDTAKDLAARVADGAKKIVNLASQRAKDARRAVRDAAMHADDKLKDLKDRIN